MYLVTFTQPKPAPHSRNHEPNVFRRASCEARMPSGLNAKQMVTALIDFMGRVALLFATAFLTVRVSLFPLGTPDLV